MPLKVRLQILFYIFSYLSLVILLYVTGYYMSILIVTLTTGCLIYTYVPAFDFSSDIKSEGHKLVALTFDDGPSEEFTEDIIEILKAKDVTATFFVIGEKALKQKNTLYKIIDAGSELGAHTMNHKKLHLYPYNKLDGHIKPVIDIIESVYNDRSKPHEFKKIFRAPHGFKSINLKIYLKRNGISLIPWIRGVWDTDAPGEEWIFKYATKNPKNLEILLLHDGLGMNLNISQEQKNGVLRALPNIIDFYKNRGYTFVKVSELLKGVR